MPMKRFISKEPVDCYPNWVDSQLSVTSRHMFVNYLHFIVAIIRNLSRRVTGNRLACVRSGNTKVYAPWLPYLSQFRFF